MLAVVGRPVEPVEIVSTAFGTDLSPEREACATGLALVDVMFSIFSGCECRSKSGKNTHHGPPFESLIETVITGIFSDIWVWHPFPASFTGSDTLHYTGLVISLHGITH
jgi:hypothetical protein